MPALFFKQTNKMERNAKAIVDVLDGMVNKGESRTRNFDVTLKIRCADDKRAEDIERLVSDALKEGLGNPIGVFNIECTPKTEAEYLLENYLEWVKEAWETEEETKAAKGKFLGEIAKSK